MDKFKAFTLGTILALLMITNLNSRVEAQDLCRLRADPGNCYASIESYYYDYRTGQCREFSYGGCGGNSNRFSTRAQCERSKRRCNRRNIKVNRY